MKEFIIFFCTDSTEIFFSKLKSAGLNYNLPSFFTDYYFAGGTLFKLFNFPQYIFWLEINPLYGVNRYFYKQWTPRWFAA